MGPKCFRVRSTSVSVCLSVSLSLCLSRWLSLCPSAYRAGTIVAQKFMSLVCVDGCRCVSCV